MCLAHSGYAVRGCCASTRTTSGGDFCLFPNPGKAPGLLSFLCANLMTHWGEPSWGAETAPALQLGSSGTSGGTPGRVSNVGPEEACPFPFHPIHLIQRTIAALMAERGPRMGQRSPALLPALLSLGPTLPLGEMAFPQLCLPGGRQHIQTSTLQGPSLSTELLPHPFRKQKLELFARGAGRPKAGGLSPGAPRPSLLSSHSGRG